MSLMSYLLGASPRASSWAPDDDRWYQPIGPMTIAGVRVDEDGARKLSAWFRGVDLLASSVAMLPFQIYERLDDDDRRVAPDHPLYEIIHDEPNDFQDAFEDRYNGVCDLIEHGNLVREIVDGGRKGFVGKLEPIDVKTVTARRLPSGRVVYDVRNNPHGTTKTFTQDEIFHIRINAGGGVWGRGVLQFARENLGIALSVEGYAGKIFSHGTLNGGVVEVPGPMAPEAIENLRNQYTTAVGEWHKPKVLINGAKLNTQNHLTPEHAQMILSRKHSIDDIARWLGVQRYLLDNSDPSFGNAEQFRQDFLDFSMGKWLRIFESAYNRQLIIHRRRFYAEFNRDAFVRGDIATRWEAHVKAVTSGIKTVNEARRAENLNKMPGGDKLMDPAFLTGKQRQTAQRPNTAPQQDDDADARARAIAVASAERLLRKEVNAVQKSAVKHATSEDDFVVAVTNFYAAHVSLVMETLKLDEAAAKDYCWSQCQQIVNGDGWLASCERWQAKGYAEGVAALAVEGL